MVKWLLCLLPLSTPVWSNDFFDKHSEGWFWYQQEERQEASKKALPNLNSSMQNPTEEMLELQKRVTDTLNKAILYPSEQNLTDYAKVYAEIMNRGQNFADSYKLMLLKNPEFDFSLQFPTQPQAQTAYQKQKRIALENGIRAFANTHGFFFFFSSTCTQCHVFAPIVKQFSAKYGIHVLPISSDGKGLPEFTVVMQDNGVFKSLKISSVPALIAIHTKDKRLIPITNGAMSLSDLEENLSLYLQKEGLL